MTVNRRDLLTLIGGGAALAATSTAGAGQVLNRDVCILGGGSAGTYAAMRLKDLGLSVAVVERSTRLGGHAQTYRDPVSGVPIDIGVVVFPDNTLVRNWFGRFGVALATAQFPAGRSAFIDFRTGLPVSAYNPPQNAVGLALLRYQKLVEGPFAFLAENGFQLPASGPLLEQLLLPFGRFAQLHGLNALMPTFFQYVQGYGVLADSPTLYVMKNMGPAVIASMLAGSFLIVPSGVGSLYDAATAQLADDLVLGADLAQVQRPEGGGVTVQANTAAGPVTVQCRKLLVTAPPLLSNLGMFDLDARERRLLGRFKPHYYWTSVVQTEGLPADYSLIDAAPETPLNLPPMPGIFTVNPTGVQGLTNLKYGSTTPLSDDAVRSAIQADLERTQLPDAGPVRVNGFAIFKSHSPYAVMVAPAGVRAGFYAQMQGLQGSRSTYYAGAAFQTHSSAAIWAFIEELLPSLAA